MGEAHALQLRERGEEVLGERGERLVVVVVLGADRAAEAIHGVVAAPQDPLVGGQPVVVEPVAGVADPLPAPPPDRLPLGGRQRLGDHRVVVDRGDVAAQRPLQRPEGAGGQQHAAGVHAPERAQHGHGPVTAAAETGGGGVLVDAHAGRQGGGAQAGGERAGVEHRGARAVPQAAAVQRRRDLGADRGPVEQLALVPEAPQHLRLLLQPRLLVGLQRDQQVPGALEGALDPVAREVGLHPVEVRGAEALEHVHLAGEAREPVRHAVGERGHAEAAVAPAGPEAGGLRLQQHDVAFGLERLGAQRGPQAGEAAADDAQVGLRDLRQRRLRVAGPQGAKPERQRLGLGVRRPVRGGGRGEGPGEGDGLNASDRRGRGRPPRSPRPPSSSPCP